MALLTSFTFWSWYFHHLGHPTHTYVGSTYVLLLNQRLQTYCLEQLVTGNGLWIKWAGESLGLVVGSGPGLGVSVVPFPPDQAPGLLGWSS